MLPNQQPSHPNQPLTPGPSHSPGFTPQAPHFEYDSSPRQSDILQQHNSGQYEVVPSLSQNPNRASGHNPYEFIMAPNTPTKARLVHGGAPSWKLLAIIGGALVVLLMVAAIIASSLAPKGSVPGLTATAQREQEIIRVANEVSNNATAQGLSNFAVNTAVVVTSNQQQTIAYLAAHKIKLKDTVLNLDKSTQTDTLLSNAATAGTYDSAALQALTSQLQTYEQTLQTAYKGTNSTGAKALLQSNFANADKLLTQAKAVDISAAN